MSAMHASPAAQPMARRAKGKDSTPAPTAELMRVSTEDLWRAACMGNNRAVSACGRSSSRQRSIPPASVDRVPRPPASHVASCCSGAPGTTATPGCACWRGRLLQEQVGARHGAPPAQHLHNQSSMAGISNHGTKHGRAALKYGVKARAQGSELGVRSAAAAVGAAAVALPLRRSKGGQAGAFP